MPLRFRVLSAVLASFFAGVASPLWLAAQSPASTASAGTHVTPILSPGQSLSAAEQSFAAAHSPVAQLVAIYRAEEAGRLLSSPTVAAAWATLAATSRLSPLIEAEIANQQAATDRREGHARDAEAIWAKLGVVENWRAVGPFDNSSPSAISGEEGPEKGIDLKARYQGKLRQVSWRTIPFSGPAGDINLAAYMNPSASASAYLVSWVRSQRDQPVALRMADSGSIRIWVNGGLVFDAEESHSSAGFDQDAAGAWLHSGWNEILAKVGDSESPDWHFQLRVTTPEGAALPLESVAAPPLGMQSTATRGNKTPSVTNLTALAKAAAGTSPTAQLDYAWILNRKQNFNQGDHLDSNAFITAIAQTQPGSAAHVAAVLDFVQHDNDASRIYQNLEELLAQDPGSAEAHLLLGSLELSRRELWPARHDLELALGMNDPAPGAVAPAEAVARAPLAALGMMEVYAGMGIRPMVLAWAQALQPEAGQTALVAAPVAATLRRMGAATQALTWFRAAHADDAANYAYTMDLVDAARQTGDLTGALATIRDAAALHPAMPALAETEARALSGLGRAPEALAAIRRAVALAPDTPGYRVAEGEIESHFGHVAAAQSAWQAGLSLNPQDASLRDRLELAKGGVSAQEASFEKPYTTTLQQAVANYQQQIKADPGLNSGPLTVLVNTTVTNVFPSGNTGRYVEQIFRVNNTSGANALSVYPVTYDPDTQEVHFLTAHVLHPDGSSADAPEAGDQPITQSVGYETFYDVRNKYVEMPPMRTGDFVEIAYRILPTTLESLYGDYYGDLDVFGSSASTLLQQYVVLTPANKHLYYKAVRFTGQSEVKTVNGETIYRWSAHNLAPQVDEPSAPPAIEQSPYIEVSAFQTWSQFAHWYRQLIRDTFVMNGEMVQTVNDLVKGKTTDQEKVDAIYRWVIQNTHYVALEFGIHGYRPYPVTQVFHRRYGDCKDKASLLIAMLHQAGIPADFVLVRIRELGLVDPTIPSVADFDHAIVYVPELHQYLDGTAEYEGADELPEGDQRAFVLHIPVTTDLAADSQNAPDASTIVTTREVTSAPMAAVAPVVTPEQPAKANVTSRVLNGQLDAQGNLHFQMSWIALGGDAPLLRQAMEVADRQAGAIQAMLHNRLPGISVQGAQVSNENDWDKPIEITLEGEIPRFATVDGRTLLIPRQILPKSWLPQMAALTQRQFPVLTDPPQILQEEMHLALPQGYQVGQLPPARSLNLPFASFQADANLNGGTLTLRSRIETRQSLVPPAQYASFRQFWSQVDQVLGRPINAQAPDIAERGGQPAASGVQGRLPGSLPGGAQ